MKKLKLLLLICLFVIIGSALYIYITPAIPPQKTIPNKPIPDVSINVEPYNPQVSRGKSVQVKIIVGGINVTKGDEIYFDYTVRLRYPNGTSIVNPKEINLSFNPQSIVFPETYNDVLPYMLYSNLTITVNENAPSGDYQIYFGKARNENLTVASQVILFSIR